MAQLNPTFFLNATSVAARAAEVPAADFDNGMNLGGSNAPGVGINMAGGAVVGTPEQFTLLDQHGAIRVPQDSQHIGGDGLDDGVEGPGTVAIKTGANAAAGDGTNVGDGTANLQTIGAGWVATAV
ncbi:unnamed protein product [marine sediment metagenome]|uniref:Uncharacterized protein n=1 Tax=marine sediment metagenome TaxID=412755 RepID=X0VGN5_9ZZZZ